MERMGSFAGDVRGGRVERRGYISGGEITDRKSSRTTDQKQVASPETKPHPLPAHGLRDGPPHSATASSSSTGHRMMPLDTAVLDPSRGLREPLQAHPHDHQLIPHDEPHAYRDHELGLFPQPALHLHPSSLQLAPPWLSLDTPVATGQSVPFVQPVGPFLVHQDTSILDFSLPSGIHSQQEAVEYDSTDVTSLHLHLPLPLSGHEPAVSFDFDFPLPPWEPTFADAIPLTGGASSLLQPEHTPSLANTRTTETNNAVHHEMDPPEASWLNDGEASSTAGRRRNSLDATPTAQTTRRKSRKGKERADSTASGSAYSASVASTRESFPFPGPISNPSNPLNTSPSHISDRRRSTRTKARARSVATTTSASSSSTAPTPSSAPGPVPCHRSRPPAAIVNSQDHPPSTTSSSRLRSASRASKNSVSRPTDTAEERRTRASHNLVEKQYRNRLNAQFEGLLFMLPDPDAAKEADATSDTGLPAAMDPADTEQQPGEKKVSKAEVLERARVHIESLERQNEALARKREMLLKNLGRAEKEMAPSGRRDLAGSLEAEDQNKRHCGERDETLDTIDEKKASAE